MGCAASSQEEDAIEQLRAFDFHGARDTREIDPRHARASANASATSPQDNAHAAPDDHTAPQLFQPVPADDDAEPQLSIGRHTSNKTTPRSTVGPSGNFECEMPTPECAHSADLRSVPGASRGTPLIPTTGVENAHLTQSSTTTKASSSAKTPTRPMLPEGAGGRASSGGLAVSQNFSPGTSTNTDTTSRIHLPSSMEEDTLQVQQQMRQLGQLHTFCRQAHPMPPPMSFPQWGGSGTAEQHGLPTFATPFEQPRSPTSMISHHSSRTTMRRSTRRQSSNAAGGGGQADGRSPHRTPSNSQVTSFADALPRTQSGTDATTTANSQASVGGQVLGASSGGPPSLANIEGEVTESVVCTQSSSMLIRPNLDGSVAGTPRSPRQSSSEVEWGPKPPPSPAAARQSASGTLSLGSPHRSQLCPVKTGTPVFVSVPASCPPRSSPSSVQRMEHPSGAVVFTAFEPLGPRPA